jgi:hypothetical protein
MWFWRSKYIEKENFHGVFAFTSEFSDEGFTN